MNSTRSVETLEIEYKSLHEDNKILIHAIKSIIKTVESINERQRDWTFEEMKCHKISTNILENVRVD